MGLASPTSFESMPTASDLPGNLHGDTTQDEGDPPPGFPPPKPPRDERPNGAIKHARQEHEPLETKYSAKEPPRLPTRVIQNPKFPVKEAEEEEEVEEIEEDIAKEMGPSLKTLDSAQANAPGQSRRSIGNDGFKEMPSAPGDLIRALLCAPMKGC